MTDDRPVAVALPWRNSFRFAWPPKSSWLSRIRIFASLPTAFLKKYAEARPLKPPPTTIRSYRSPVSSEVGQVFASRSE
jgi:hypothetical protein